MKKAKVSKYGQWKYPGQDTIIPNANGSITMKGVPYPVLGIDDQGNRKMMMPGGEYQFPGNSVYEIPMAKNGGTKKVKIKSLPKAQSGPNTTDPEKPYGSTKGIPSNPYQVINGQYVFTLPDNTTWSTSNRRQADSINAHLARGWGFTGERTTAGEPAWARIPKETTDPKKLTVEDAGTSNDPDVQKVIVNTPKGDVTKLQNLKTKKFIGYEVLGSPVNINNATGDPSVDFRKNFKAPIPLKPEDETLAAKDTNYRDGYYSFANMMGNKSPATLLPQHYAMYNEGIPYMNPDFKSALLQNRYSLPSGYSNDLQNQGYTFFPESGTWGIDINKQGPGEMGYKKFGGVLPKAQTGPGRGPGRGSGFLYGQPSTSNATYQDSLDVANQGQAVMDWYNSQGYYGGTDLSSDYVDVRARGERRTNYSGGRGSDLNFGRDDVNSGYNIHVPGSIGDAGLNLSNSMHNLVDRDNIAEWINPNQFRQYADQNLVILNDNAPKALYDTRIKPRTFLELRGMAPGYFSGNTDIVNAPIYEKWYSAPWVGLSEEDKRKRIQFGILDGTPYDGWDDPDLASRFPDLIGGGSSSDTQTYDAETVKNAGLSGYEATQEGAAEYARNNWARKEAEKKKDPNPDTDVVHYMREVEGRSRGETTYENRKKIAEELGIDNYSGTAQQNIELIKRLKEQKSAKENVAETVVIPEREMRPQIIPNTPAKEIDGERRAYPIKFTGDGATDKMIMQLYGPQGEFTDNGYIPLDDPKYNPYKTLMPKDIRDQQ